MKNSRRLDRLGRGIFARNDLRKETYRCLSLRNSSASLLDLSLGSTDLLPPPLVIEAITNGFLSSGSSAYCLQAGTRPFREAASAWVQRRFGVNVDPDQEVLLLVGSQEGTAHLPLAILNSGETGLILDPSYPSHRGGLVLADARIEKLMLRPEKNWEPDIKSLSKSKWDQLRLIIFGYPHNPTAQVGGQNLLDEMMQCALKHQVVVAHDNPYVDLALEGEAPCLLKCKGWRELGIEFFSFSKAWSMGGFRMGFAIGAAPVLEALRGVKSVVDFNQSLALQAGGIAALEKASDWPLTILEIYRERRDRVVESLINLGWRMPTPSMAMYIWLPLPTWAKVKGWTDEDFAAALLNQTGVALTPGSGFGRGGKNWLRLALVRPVDDLEAAVARIVPWWHEHS